MDVPFRISTWNSAVFDEGAGPGAWRRASNRPRGERFDPAGGKLLAGRSSQGAVAQLGERLICIQEAVGSIPISSTSALQCSVENRACSSGG